MSPKGDTISGYINYQDWGITPKEISFKKEMDKKKTNYSPKEIKAFGVAEDIYRSASVETAWHSDRDRNLDDHSILNLRVDTIFLQALILGEKSLFQITNNSDVKNFYLLDDHKFSLLKYKKYKDKIDDVNKISEIRTYLTQLRTYFKDCSSIQTKITDTQYTKGSLKKLFSAYYKDCTSQPIEFEKHMGRTEFKFGLTGGGSFSSLKFKRNPSRTNIDKFLTDSDFSNSIDLSVGFFMEIRMPLNRKKWSLYNELLFSRFTVDAQYSNFYHEDRYTNYDTKIGLNQLILNSLVRYHILLKNNASIFLNGGLATGLSSFNKNETIQFTKFYSTPTTKTIKPIRNFEPLKIGSAWGIGLKYRKLSTELRYENINENFQAGIYRSSIHKFYLLVGYSFNG
ncbi:MAG: outer membrane beta-barrel protein [Saprospiraceae bacterium]